MHVDPARVNWFDCLVNDLVLGDMAVVADVISVLVGLAGVYAIYFAYQLGEAS